MPAPPERRARLGIYCAGEEPSGWAWLCCGFRATLPSPTVYYEGLQDKLAQIRDARGALSALREEHREKLRRAAEEAERQRQIQLAQKLEIMRQKKQVRWLAQCAQGVRGQARASLSTTLSLLQEYLEVQRQLAIQRLQEQEKERQMRLEQQKQTVQMRAQMPAFPLPYAQAWLLLCPAHAALPCWLRPPLTAVSSLSPAPGHACSRWGDLPALGPRQLPWHLQPGRLGGGLAHARRVPEPGSPGRQPLLQHAWHRGRYQGSEGWDQPE